MAILSESVVANVAGHIDDHAELKAAYDSRAGAQANQTNYSRGINLSGAEFAHDAAHLPGVFNTDYMYPSQADFTYVASRGNKVVRLPIRWERIQPTLNGALNSAELSRLTTAISQANSAGLKVLIDVHNYARFINSTANGGAEWVLGGGTLTNAHLTDLWVRLSTALKGNPAVLGYGLMNEPHTLPGGASQWQTASQACVDAIRNNSDSTTIYVPGYAWSGAQNWPTNHPTPWITGTNIVYEAHYYFDRDNSGTYQNTYAAENTDATSRGFSSLTNRATTELGRFSNWCTSNNVQGFIGEMGWSNTGDTASWNAVGNACYAALDTAKIGATYWAAGQWYSNTYNLSVYTGSPLSVTASPATVVESHPTSVTQTQTGNLPVFTASTTDAQHTTIHNLLHSEHNALGAPTVLPQNATTGHLGHHNALHKAHNLRSVWLTRSGTTLKLGAQGSTYRTIGYNSYVMRSAGGTPEQTMTAAQRDAFFAQLPAKSLVRVWAFMPVTNTYSDATVFAEQDAIVASAKKYGHRLIFTLADSGGAANDGTGAKPVSWFTGAQWTGAYQTWLDKIVPRYATEPTVAIWDLMNEPHTSSNSADLLNFVNAMGARVKSKAPSALVMLGINTPAQSAGSAANYQTVMGSAQIDVCSFHDYDEFPNVAGYFYDVLAAARALNKPILVDEMGIYAGPTHSATLSPANYSTVSHATQASIIAEKIKAYATYPEVAYVGIWSGMEAGINYPAYEPAPGSATRTAINSGVLNVPGFNTQSVANIDGWFKGSDAWRSADGATSSRMWRRSNFNYYDGNLVGRHSVRLGKPAWECGVGRRVWVDMNSGSSSSTFFAVVQPTTLTSGARHYIFGSDGNGGLALYIDGTTRKVTLLGLGATNIGTSVATLTAGTTYLIEAHYSASSGAWSIVINGTVDSSGVTLFAVATQNSVLGAQFSYQNGGEFVGNLYECLKFTSDLSSTDSGKVRTYLMGEYSLSALSAAPSITGTSVTGTTASLSYTAPASPGITGYYFYIFEPSATPQTPGPGVFNPEYASPLTPGTENPYVFTNLQPGHTYQLGVAAANSNGVGQRASTTVTTTAAPSNSGFTAVITGIPGLTHYYPLNNTTQAQDVVGTLDGTVTGGVTFAANGATFSGTGYITIPDNLDMTLFGRSGFTVVSFMTVTNWEGASPDGDGYIHWMGKGTTPQAEWVFRHYQGSHGTRPKRTSAYYYSLDARPWMSSNQGAGSYFQDDDAAGTENVIAGVWDSTTTSGVAGADSEYPGMSSIWKNATLRDSDGFGGSGAENTNEDYDIVPGNGNAPVRIGSRDATSKLIGRIRRVAFFNRKLTAAEMSTIYNNRALPD